MNAAMKVAMWGGQGISTRTGAGNVRNALIVHECRVNAFRTPEDWRIADALCIDAPAEVARGSVYFSHERGDTAVLFASDTRGGQT